MSETGPLPAVRVVLVTGLSGAGKASVLRTLEDLGFETVDNPPLEMLETLVRDECQRSQHSAGLAIGIDARSRGFDAAQVMAAVARMRALRGVELELIYVLADEETLLGRFTETRRRHPLSPRGRVSEGIVAERELTNGLRAAADLVIDSSDLKLSELRQLVEAKFGRNAGQTLAISVISFAFPRGLPRDADMVFDARFLRNPHYDPILRSRTGLDPDVAAFIEADPDFAGFMKRVTDLLQFLLPRFVREGKKYATFAVGCTGGQHRSVHVAEKLARALCCVSASSIGFNVSVSHRELGNNVCHNLPLVFLGQDQNVGLDQPAENGEATVRIRPWSPETKL